MTAWSLQGVRDSGKRIDISAQYPTFDASDGVFDNTGFRFFTVGGTDGQVQEWALPKRYDTAGATLAASHEITELVGQYVSALAFKSDGKKLYCLVHNSTGSGPYYRRIVPFPLSAAWDLATVGVAGAPSSVLVGSSLISLSFRPDGRRCFVTDGATRTLHAYDIPTAWAVDALTNPGESLVLSAVGATGGHACFSLDGAKVFAGGLASGVFEFHLPTPWFLTDGSYSGVSCSTRAYGPKPLFSRDGTKLFVLTSSPGDVGEYHVERVTIPGDPVPITDHVALALDRLPARLQGKPRIEALIRSWAEPANEIEAAAHDLYIMRWLDTAFGAQLDGLGDILNRPRNEQEDERYRIVLKAQIFALFQALGSADDYITLIGLLETYGLDHTVEETYPAEDVITLEAIPVTPMDLLWEMLNLIRCLGVRLVLEYPTTDPDESFAFASGDEEEDSDFGFAETEDDPGGTFVWSVSDSDIGLTP